MRSAVTVSLVPQARGGPFVYWDGLESAFREAAALGFDAIEIFPASADNLNPPDIQRWRDKHGLRVAAVGTGAGWLAHRLTLTHAEREVRLEARRFVRRVVEAAGAVGAPAIIGSMQGRAEGTVPREQALEWLGEALEEMSEAAASFGVPLLIEPLNRYETNLLNRLGDTFRWLDTIRASNVRILADLFHMNIEEADSAAALVEACERVGHVHFADSNRRAIGFGQIRLLPIAAALREIKYEGYLSAEILPLPDSATASRQTITAFRQAFPHHSRPC